MVRPITDAKSYVGETGKSMKAVELAVSRKGSWRKIPISPTTHVSHGEIVSQDREQAKARVQRKLFRVQGGNSDLRGRKAVPVRETATAEVLRYDFRLTARRIGRK